MPKYLVSNNHPAIIDRDTFKLVQLEKARRGAKSKKSDSNITELGKYSGKYALSELLICGECGTPYRRRISMCRGEKKVYWRCINRIEHGTTFCKNSIGVEEEKLHNAICSALSMELPDKDGILQTIKATLAYTTSGNQEAIDIYNIEVNIKQLQEEASLMMDRAMNTEGDTEKYFSEIEKIYSKIKILREQLDMLRIKSETSKETPAELKRITEIIENEELRFTEYDDIIVRRIVDFIRVMSDKSIIITLKGGIELIEKI